ncbi:MAG: preprotein translocase subunit SecY [Clostridia bacterium]|nr:preprotein translocase subunit SecY [Clostridia bacterium]
MFKTIANAWKIPDLRKKMLFTILIVVIFRIGSVIPVPFLDVHALKVLTDSWNDNNNMLSYIDMFSGGAFSNATLFAMSVTPYINSSIIMQLLTVAIPALERLAKEGTEGRKKIATITRYVTVLLGIIQGTAYYIYLLRSQVKDTDTGAILNIVEFKGWNFSAVFAAITIVLVFTAGTALMMWLGEQINQNGLGNGISILLFVGIIARLPVTFGQLWSTFELGLKGQTEYIIYPIIYIVLSLVIVWVIVFMNDAERRIPVQYAKRMVGRKMYGGQSTHLPIKVGLSGVMPIIFASSILSIPQTILLFLDQNNLPDFWKGFFNAFSPRSWIYIAFYFVLIIGFAYFYVTIQYNPLEMSNNLRQSNGTIPGIRPGKPTTDFIAKIISKITLIGALFLAFIAIVPLIFANLTNMTGLMMGGTSVIILVGVALETMRQLESQMMMRHYKGFLD